MTDVAATRTARERLIEQLRAENAQLERALESRIVIEQAKGILAERYQLPVDDAFELLRRSARSSRVQLRGLAARVVAERATPDEIELTLARPLSGGF